jgi:hypothetical protein
MKKCKERYAINDKRKKRVSDPLSKLMRKVGLQDLECKSLHAWPVKRLRTLNASAKYQSLLEDYRHESSDSTCDHVSRQILVELYLHIHSLFPEMGRLDILAKILQDTTESWIRRVMNEIDVLDVNREVRKSASSYETHGLDQASSVIEMPYQTEDVDVVGIVPSGHDQIFENMPRMRSCDGEDLEWIPCEEESANAAHMPIGYTAEAPEPPLVQDETDCLGGCLKA